VEGHKQVSCIYHMFFLKAPHKLNVLVELMPFNTETESSHRCRKIHKYHVVFIRGDARSFD